MTGWHWLTNPQTPYRWGFIIRVIIKAGILFAAINLIFALLNPVPTIGKASLYNLLFRGRERLPYGENPAEAYNLSLNDLNAMFASHTLAGGKEDGEFRVILIGDSATWGFLLEDQDTLAGQLNGMDLGQGIQVYNVGYPTMSLTKDVLLLERALTYEPDLIIWLVTLESFPSAEQLDSPLAANNRQEVLDLVEHYSLSLPTDDLTSEPDFWGRTLVGQRRPLADWLRLQVYGMAWQSTGVDQAIPKDYTLRQSDFDTKVNWHGLNEPQAIPEGYLAWDVLEAGMTMPESIPILLVNEPMFISTGQNSDLRYNFFYPRWVYDAYREQLGALVASENWDYVDLWDAIPPEEFTDSPVHMTPAGMAQLADLLAPTILEHARTPDES